MRSFLYTIRQTIDAFSKPIAGPTSNTEVIPITKIEALVRIALTFMLIYIVMYLFRIAYLWPSTNLTILLAVTKLCYYN